MPKSTATPGVPGKWLSSRRRSCRTWAGFL